MRLGYEKARRRDMVKKHASSPIDRICGSLNRKTRGANKNRRKQYRNRPKGPPPISAAKPTRLILEIHGPDFILKSWWLRKGPNWTCTQADPKLEWFRRITHPASILGWINQNHFHYRWIKPQSHTEAQAAPIPATVPEPQTCTAQTYTLNKPASGAFHGNSAACLNSTPSGVHQTRSVTSDGTGAEWLKQSSPLNCLGVSQVTKELTSTLPC